MLVPDITEPAFAPAPRANKYTALPMPERFWSKIDVRGKEDCWNWKHAIYIDKKQKGNGGYGVFDHDRAHRWSWKLTNGPIPKGKWVLHKCDNRRCCNPNHLFLGTHQDNVDDMVRKGRQAKRESILAGWKRYPRGEYIGTSEFTNDEVLTIRGMFHSGVRIREISVEFGRPDNTISSIVYGIRWPHLPGAVHESYKTGHGQRKKK